MDLSSVLFENAKVDERNLFWRMRGKRAVRSGPWKLRIEEQASPELYHLGKDISERNNVADSNPHKVTELLDALKAWEADVERSAPAFR